MSFFTRRNRNISATELKFHIMEESVPSGFTMGKPVSGKSLKAGMKVLAYYNSTNQGCDVIEILGVTGDEEKYGKGGVKFSSVEECLKYYNCKSLLVLEASQNIPEYGHHSYLVARDLSYEVGDKSSIDETRQGPWYYLFEGRWARGSGAEKLSFVELLPVDEKPSRFKLED